MRIAILGGTFDPIHNGHLAAARTVAETFDIDEVHFITAFFPPHKPRSDITSPFHRFAMVALATAPFDDFRVSTVESDVLESRYSVDTLELMHRTYPTSSFVFITGADMYSEIEDWRNYRRLFELTSFAVLNRPGFSMREDIAPVEVVRGRPKTSIEKGPRVYYLPDFGEDVSSTRIREEAKKGNSLDRWIPSTVQTYIAKHKLYE